MKKRTTLAFAQMKRAIKLACRCCQNIVIRHLNDHLVPLWNPLQVSYYVAEFWNTVSNVFIFAPPIFGIADALYQGRIIFDSELLLRTFLKYLFLKMLLSRNKMCLFNAACTYLREIGFREAAHRRVRVPLRDRAGLRHVSRHAAVRDAGKRANTAL